MNIYEVASQYLIRPLVELAVEYVIDRQIVYLFMLRRMKTWYVHLEPISSWTLVYWDAWDNGPEFAIWHSNGKRYSCSIPETDMLNFIHGEADTRIVKFVSEHDPMHCNDIITKLQESAMAKCISLLDRPKFRYI